MNRYISFQPYFIAKPELLTYIDFPCIRKIRHKLKLVKKNDEKQFMVKF